MIAALFAATPGAVGGEGEGMAGRGWCGRGALRGVFSDAEAGTLRDIMLPIVCVCVRVGNRESTVRAQAAQH